MSDQTQPGPGENLHLQQFGLKDSTYERPNQNWVCGHLSDGSPCAVGPSAKGRCLATAECRPFKKGDRWICTRRDTAAAPSPCEQGPLPDGGCCRPIARCAPVRSIRAKRARCAFGAFALSLGVLSFLLLGPARSDFVKPGDLTNAHALVLRSQRAEDCEACHVAGKGDAKQWLVLALAPAAGAVQNEKCLKCHHEALGNDAARPHSLSAEKLARISERARPSSKRTPEQVLASFAPPAATTPHGDLACATCHQEHGGRRHDLKSLPNISCQVCHKDQFESFAHGHPEFKAVRHDRAGIAFDHAAHQPRMPGGKLACARCHRPDPAARTMQFPGFEQACGGCHDQGKLDHHGDQIRSDIRVVFQLSSMDLGSAGIWPDKKLTPGSALTPMLQFLIAGDENPDALKALKSLNADVVAKGSTDDWDAEPEAKARLASAIKRVVKELSLDDDAPPRPSNRALLRARIARAAGTAPQAAVVTEMLDQLTGAGDEIKSWQQHCLPQLADDLAGKLKPATTPAAGQGSAGDAKWKPPKEGSGWFVDTDAVSVSYHPSHADAFYKSCIDLLASSAGQAKPPAIIEKMTNDAFLTALRVRLLIQFGGSCIKCHALQPAGDSFAVNWQAAGHATRVAGYVKFDHRPHLTLFAGDDKCLNCHQLAIPAPDQGHPPAPSLSVSWGDPNHGIAAHDIAGCAVCHTPSGAPDTCLTCHVYHMKR